ncbi:hypothetical protein QKW35_16425 [Pontibacterium granulatum]|uniref:hypothetical protein n=1 Tax=Pontibacterium granulatum TaxID=2036029 RepID=UPI00249A63A4|nr:hypothetical protein [Pontibacterium granulatum]MDI3325966.1 hypothetical protein [Pontibacterium granulatum]
MGLEDKLYPLLDVYYRLPEPVAKFIGGVYSSLPDRWIKGKEYEAFLELAENTTVRQEYLEYQFLSMVASAKKTDFYQELYSDHGVSFESVKDLRDLKRLPTISKDDVKANIDRMVCSDLRSKGLYLTTGGSTGHPVGFFLEKGVTRPKEAAFIDSLWKKCGFFKGAKIAVIRGLAFKSNDGISRLDPIKNALMLSSGQLTFENVGLYVDRLNAFKPDFLHAYPSSVYLLARLLKKAGVRLDFCPRYIFCGSENIYPEHLSLIEEVFGAPVFSWYGHTERVLLAERLTDGRYRFLDHYGIAEVVDDYGINIGSGLGELCGTGLNNGVMPLIRYRSQDMVLLDDGCQRNDFSGPLIVASIEGRSHEFVYSKARRPVSMTMINMHSSVFDNIERFQFVQREIGCVVFQYRSLSELSDNDLCKIERALLDKLGDGFALKTERVNDIALTRNGKQTFLKQEIVI